VSERPQPPVSPAANVPEWVTLEDVAGIIRAAARGAEDKGGLTECSAAALNSWAEVIERNLKEAESNV
jgi:hypothetical protein